MFERLETDAIRDVEDNHPLLHQKRNLLKVQAAEEKVHLEQEAGFRADISLGKSVRKCHVLVGTLPVCLNHKSESGCTNDEKCRFRHSEAGGQPSKKSKKSV